MKQDNWQTRITLLQKIKDQHDEAAWEDFVYFYKAYIYKIILSMNITVSEADDLAQKILLKLWEKLPEFEYQANKGSFRSWLCTVIKNHARNYIRDNQTRRKKLFGEEPEGQNVEPSLDADIEVIAEREWKVHVARLAWDNVSKVLPENHVEIFTLHANGSTIEEVEEKTGIKKATAYVYLKRCRDKLKSEIKRLTEELL